MISDDKLYYSEENEEEEEDLRKVKSSWTSVYLTGGILGIKIIIKLLYKAK